MLLVRSLLGHRNISKTEELKSLLNMSLKDKNTFFVTSINNEYVEIRKIVRYKIMN